MYSLKMKITSLLVVTMMMSGCATMFGRQHDEEAVTFDANVAGVEVNCSGKRTITPGNIPLMQSKKHTCSAEKAGYEKKVFQIRSGTSWSGFGYSTAINGALWGWWTLGIGIGIGWLIDWPSGAMRNLKEENIYLEMKPEGTTSVSQKVAEKTVEIGKAIVETPVDIVKNTTTTVMDTTIAGGAGQMGLTDGKATPAPSKDSEKQKNVKVI